MTPRSPGCLDMISGMRRTWVFSVFVLGVVILGLHWRRLAHYDKTGKQILANEAKERLRISIPSNISEVAAKDIIQVGDARPNKDSLNSKNPLAGDRPHKEGLKSRNPLPTMFTYMRDIQKSMSDARKHSKALPLVSRATKIPKQLNSKKPMARAQLPAYCKYDTVPSPNDFLKEPQNWQKVSKRTIMVFSAYFDRRKEIKGPLIRVLASGKQTRFGHSGRVFCVLWVMNASSIVGIPTEASYNVIYDSILHPSMYTAHFILCNTASVLGRHKSILGISVVPDVCGARNNVLEVKVTDVRLSPGINTTFGACLSPMYGRYNNGPALIEFMEMHRILGVTKFTVYDLSVSANVKRILEKYKAEGLVDIIRWNYPYSRVLCDYFAQREALNDCLYRNMGTTKFLAFIDLDEIITPRKTLQWPSMFSRIYKKEYGAYMFQHTYFLNTNKKTTKATLLTQTVFSRPSIVFPPGKVRCKTIYETEKAVKINIHFPYALVPGSKEFLVPPEEAILHHYRSDVMQIFHDGKRNFTYVKDMYMLNYASRIQAAFSNRLKAFAIL